MGNFRGALFLVDTETFYKQCVMEFIRIRFSHHPPCSAVVRCLPAILMISSAGLAVREVAQTPYSTGSTPRATAFNSRL